MIYFYDYKVADWPKICENNFAVHYLVDYLGKSVCPSQPSTDSATSDLLMAYIGQNEYGIVVLDAPLHMSMIWRETPYYRKENWSLSYSGTTLGPMSALANAKKEPCSRAYRNISACQLDDQDMREIYLALMHCTLVYVVDAFFTAANRLHCEHDLEIGNLLNWTLSTMRWYI